MIQESKLRQATQQNASLKSEFQQYKARAHALLEQKNLSTNNIASTGSGNDTSELISINKKLESDLRYLILYYNYPLTLCDII